jgi:hypothetical protein
MSRTGTHVSLSVPVFDDAAPVSSLEVIAALPADVHRFVTAVRSAGERMSRGATPRSAVG